jgi:hypothetical protein
MRLRLRELREGEGVAERSGSELGRKEDCVWCCCVCVATASACAAENAAAQPHASALSKDFPCLHKSSG